MIKHPLSAILYIQDRADDHAISVLLLWLSFPIEESPLCFPVFRSFHTQVRIWGHRLLFSHSTKKLPWCQRYWISRWPLLCSKHETIFTLDFHLRTEAFYLLLFFTSTPSNTLGFYELVFPNKGTRYGHLEPCCLTVMQYERVLPCNTSYTWSHLRPLTFPLFL